MALPDLCHDTAPGPEAAVPEWVPSEGNYWWRPKEDGLFPDSSRFQPGDIFLFRPLTPNLLQRSIIAHQKRFCSNWKEPEEHAFYTHSAMYLGYDGLLSEAVWPKVLLSSLDDKIRGHCIRIRRAPHLTGEERRKLAEAAASLRNVKYGWTKLVELRFTPAALRRRLPAVHSEDEQRSLICSTLCSHALKHVGVSVLPPDLGIAVPAFLSLTASLIDGKIGWCRYSRVLPAPARAMGTGEPRQVW